jgi:hypothetical protein
VVAVEGIAGAPGLEAEAQTEGGPEAALPQEPARDEAQAVPQGLTV